MANLKYFNNTTASWEEIKVSTRLKDLYNTKKLTQDQSYVEIGVTSFNPNEDVLFTICNSTWLQKDEDYVINGGLLRIESKDGSNWKSGTTFNFVVLKNVDKDALPSADGALLQDRSVTIAKLATSLQNYINKIGVADISAVGVTLSDAINKLSTSLSDMANNKADKTQLLVVESGSWTPTFLTSTGQILMSKQMGTYYKQGKIVHIKAVLTVSNLNGASGTVTIGGLPFISKGIQCALSMGCSPVSNLLIMISYNSNMIQLLVNNLSLQVSNMSNSFEIYFSGTYITE